MAMRGRDKFSKAKPILNLLSGFYALFPQSIRKKLLVHYRNTKGIRGLVIRFALLKTIAISCGDNVSIQPDCYLFFPERMEIGNNVSLHPMCYLDAVGGISIGNDVSIAHGTTVMSSSHMYNNYDIPIKDQEYVVEKTVIEDNVWVGAKVTILCGKHIGTGAVIGAGAVVTRDIAPNTVNAGVPAKAIRER